MCNCWLNTCYFGILLPPSRENLAELYAPCWPNLKVPLLRRQPWLQGKPKTLKRYETKYMDQTSLLAAVDWQPLSGVTFFLPHPGRWPGNTGGARILIGAGPGVFLVVH